jgi:hypothetical protein
MHAVFVQVAAVELDRLRRDGAAVEALFAENPFALAAGDAGGILLGEGLATAPPEIRRMLEAGLAAGRGGEAIQQLLERQAAGPVRLDLEKAWHGVHYLLCGSPEPGESLLSQVVMGGAPLNEDEEGLAGYGPARYFVAMQVEAMARELNRPGLDAEAEERFDAARMSQLNVYPGWQAMDRAWAMEGVRNLRAFFTDAAQRGRAVVTSLV